MRRRGLLVLGGVAALAIALPPVLRRLPSDFDFVALPGMPGFRLLLGGATSGGPDPFAGLAGDAPRTAGFADAASACRALFGPGGWTRDRLPVAVFGDFKCPYCKELEAQLLALEASGAPIRLIWHELPLLGEASRRAARAVLAAGLLGAGDAARDYLWHHALPPGPVGLRRMAAALELDPQALQRHAEGPQVDALLSQGLALGAGLGLVGTPGTVLGRTLVIGAIRPADQRKLIALERRAPDAPCT